MKTQQEIEREFVIRKAVAVLANGGTYNARADVEKLLAAGLLTTPTMLAVWEAAKVWRRERVLSGGIPNLARVALDSAVDAHAATLRKPELSEQSMTRHEPNDEQRAAARKWIIDNVPKAPQTWGVLDEADGPMTRGMLMQDAVDLLARAFAERESGLSTRLEAAESELARLRPVVDVANEVLALFPDAKIINDLEPLDAPLWWDGRRYAGNPVRSKQLAKWRAALARAESAEKGERE